MRIDSLHIALSGDSVVSWLTAESFATRAFGYFVVDQVGAILGLENLTNNDAKKQRWLTVRLLGACAVTGYFLLSQLDMVMPFSQIPAVLCLHRCIQ